MFKHLLVLAAFAVSSVAVAHADSINGFVSAFGNDQFTSNTVTFGSASVSGTINGTFASYLTDGDAVHFLAGTLPYTQGNSTMAPPNTQILSITGGGETFGFIMDSYGAAYGALPGCISGGTCLTITGFGHFTGTGVVAYDDSPASFTFTSQYVPGATSADITTFSTSASTSPVPEPASLALLGTGLLGAVGIVRRRFNA